MNMIVNIHLHQTLLDPIAKDLLIEKILKELERYKDLIISIDCEIDNLSSHKGKKTSYSVRLLVKVPQALLRIKKEGNEIRPTLDKTLEYLVKRIKDYKKKFQSWHTDNTWIDSQIIEDTTNNNMSNSLKYNDFVPLVRIKQLPGIPPMSVSEAIFKMEMLGRQSFLFQNIKTHMLELIYNDNGDYIIIRPPQTF